APAAVDSRLATQMRTGSGGRRRMLVRNLHRLLSAVVPCPSDVYRARGAHGQACLRDSTLSSARPYQCPKQAPTSTTLREPCSYSFRLYDQSVTAVTDVSLVSL